MTAINPGDRVLVTGAGGFIGSAITRQLVGRHAQVVAVVEPGAGTRNLDGLDVERVMLDLRNRDDMRRAVEGCRVVFHVAALYRFWARDPRQFYDVNVGGTLNVMDGAARAGTERIVYTSTVATLGLDGARPGHPADEESYADVSHLWGSYKQSKYVAEHEVLRAAAEGLAVTLVLPTTPLGPRDLGPTPTGRIVLDFLNGRMPAYVDTALNVVHVDDVAHGHLLALERGAVGRSYIVGGENQTLRHLLAQIAACTGLPPARVRVPRGLVTGLAQLSELVEGRVLRRPPAVPLEAVRMSSTQMVFDDRRARTELGYTSRPAVEAIEDSARWFVESGCVRPQRQARISWSGGSRGGNAAPL